MSGSTRVNQAHKTVAGNVNACTAHLIETFSSDCPEVFRLFVQGT
jgi:hypothetical protein